MTTDQLLRQISRRLDAIEKHLQAEQERMFTTEQAAELIGCSSGALRMKASRGQIACGKNSKGRLYFKRTDIINYINQ